MDEQSRIVTLAANGRLLDENGHPVTPPEGWAFLPAGDAGVTRKVSSAGVFWRVQVKMGRRIISKGLWAPKNTIELAVLQMQSTRQTELYQKKVEAAKRRREKIQTEYVDDFCNQVERFLNFHPIYKDMGAKMAKLVSLHATPVGSGTVARTATISIEERASRAVIAWMRHQTTAYDQMPIARVKGERRRVRRMLAQRSVELLESYRKGEPIKIDCPLHAAL
ncbi:MAG: DUF2293 domain-containing protein [Parabacteroides sp.]|nr:DUF2293 domain-containing protein [Parabacteroides sp.]MBP9481952.1 DUF2293 domain-containing protein [Parabacteroides sp.]MBP9579939.1 DUF2293 domain-containing protein [Parabacteroides sp.]